MQIVYEVLSGSHAYGLATETADEDIRGIFMPSDTDILGFGYWETIEQKPDKVYHSLRKFLNLALKANPSILAWLWVRKDFVRIGSPLSYELRANRERFLSKLVHKTFGGYATSQLKKMEKSVGGDKGYAMHGERDATKDEASCGVLFDCKNATHLVRLLYCGHSLLKYGFYPVYIEDEDWKKELWEIRKGERTIEQVLRLSRGFFTLMDEAEKHTKLPDEPDKEWVTKFLVEQQRKVVISRT